MQINQINDNTYDLPTFIIKDNQLEIQEEKFQLSFVRPSINIVSDEDLSKAAAILNNMTQKENLTEQDKALKLKLEELVEKGKYTEEAKKGVVVGDLLTLVIQELKLLKAHPQAIIKAQELQFWMSQQAEK